ncbi:MAG: ATP-binding protein [Candidatus Gracilibacteria bacterium]|nr:ATP-binding protein [Candidatus Gracilibacteria bacterium]
MEIIDIDSFPEEIDKKDFLIKHIEKDMLDLEFHYKSDFTNTKVLRDFIDTIFVIFNIKDLWKSRFVLISDELNNNAIEYGTKSGDLNKMRLLVSKNDLGILINLEVIDSGNGEKSKNSKEMEDLRLERLDRGFDNHRGIRGRGLFQIIHKIVDDLYFKDSSPIGLIVGVHKQLNFGTDIN